MREDGGRFPIAESFFADGLSGTCRLHVSTLRMPTHDTYERGEITW